MRRSAVILLSLLGLALALTSPVSGHPASAGMAPTQITELRICPSELYDRKRDVCVRDTRGQPLASSLVACSIRAVVRTSSVLQARWVYNGGIVYEYPPIRLGPGVYPHSISWGFQRRALLPGGSWRCEFELGTTQATAALGSRGPRGRIVGVAACAGAEAERLAGYLACPHDEADAPLVAPSGIICNAVFVSAARGRIELLAAGKPATDPLTVELSAPIQDVYAEFRSASVFRKPAPPPGRYACRFTALDAAGRTLRRLERPITVE